jgi:peptide chain release factor 1
MKPSIEKKLVSLVERLVELDRFLADPNVVNDMDSYRKITREHAELSPVVDLFKDYQKSEADIAAAQEIAG